MRAAEVGLHKLAANLGIPDAEWETEGYLLKHVDGALRKMEEEAKSSAKEKRMQYYAQARIDLAAFNNAYRKHVAHARENYGEPEAMKIFERVRSLMQQLATDAP